MIIKRADTNPNQDLAHSYADHKYIVKNRMGNILIYIYIGLGDQKHGSRHAYMDKNQRYDNKQANVYIYIWIWKRRYDIKEIIIYI